MSPVVQLQHTLSQDHLRVADINVLLTTLMDRKRQLESEESEVELAVLHDFLQLNRSEKDQVRAPQLRRRLDVTPSHWARRPMRRWAHCCNKL